LVIWGFSSLRIVQVEERVKHKGTSKDIVETNSIFQKTLVS